MLMGGNESYFPKIHIFEVRVSLRTSSKCRHDRASAAHIAYVINKIKKAAQTNAEFLIFHFGLRPAART